MKINERTDPVKAGSLGNKNFLNVLLALAFFAGTPMWVGKEPLPFAPPNGVKNPDSRPSDES
jgi:hypothetical protein